MSRNQPLPAASDGSEALFRTVKAISNAKERWEKMREMLVREPLPDHGSRWLRNMIVQIMDLLGEPPDEDVKESTSLPSETRRESAEYANSSVRIERVDVLAPPASTSVEIVPPPAPDSSNPTE